MSLKLKVGLALAAKYVRQGVFEPNQQTEEKAFYYAKRYAQKKDKERLLSIIDCIVDVSMNCKAAWSPVSLANVRLFCCVFVTL